MSKPDRTLDEIADEIRGRLSTLDEARERVLPLCRDTIRQCSLTIRALHRREAAQAGKHLDKAASLILEITQATTAQAELRFTGFVRDAQKEFSEANITLALIQGNPLPTPQELAVDPTAYLHGLADAVGELRRYLLDSMRRDDFSQGENILAAMDDIYNVLVTMDFPDAVTFGLRRATDMVRGILERTRSDLTLLIRQRDIATKLERLDKGA